MSWMSGYPAELPYIAAYYPEQSPVHLELAGVFSGVDAPRAARPYRFLELGCGVGASLAVLAASNPSSEFVGVDFSPAEIRRGLRLASEAGLSNLKLVEADFVDLAKERRSLGTFDFVVCHGVYTWVAPDVRRAIVDILGASTEPGALVYVGYNSLPGWAGAIGLQKLLALIADGKSGDSDARFQAALADVIRLRDEALVDVDLDFLPDSLKSALDKIASAPASAFRYAAHEYLSKHWSPLFRIDLVRDLERAKLDFIGTTHLLDRFPETMLSPAQRALFDGRPATTTAQLLEFVRPPRFRRDVFARGRAPIQDHVRRRRVANTLVTLLCPPDDFVYQTPVHLGVAEVPRNSYQPLVERVGVGVAETGSLVDLAARNGSHLGAEEIVAMLVGSGQAAPCVSSEATSDPRLLKANGAVAEFALSSDAVRHLALASPRIGGGFPTETPSMSLYQILSAEDAGPYTNERLRRMEEALIAATEGRGESFFRNGVEVAGDDEKRSVARIAVDRGVSALAPKWRALGIL